MINTTYLSFRRFGNKLKQILKILYLVLKLVLKLIEIFKSL